MTTALDQLEALADQVGREREAAEQHEAELRRLLAEGRAAAEAADRREAELADVLEWARAAEEAARERLGACRAQTGAAEREHETVADQAAGGDAAAVKKLRASRDHAEELAALVRAHERRVAQLEGAREVAEQALAEHQAKRADVTGRVLEGLMLEVAAAVDDRLVRAGELAGLAFELYRARRGPEKPYQTAWNYAGHAFEVIQAAFLRATLPVNSALQGGLAHQYPTFADRARNIVGLWKLNRGETPEPQRAA